MNPEIQKFWEDAGYQICVFTPGRSDLMQYFHALDNGAKESYCIANVVLSYGEMKISYFLTGGSGQKYSEEEMLKIIRMKAFL
jgi:hypothetical protein